MNEKYNKTENQNKTENHTSQSQGCSGAAKPQTKQSRSQQSR